MENKRPEWSSNLSFLLAAIGSAVGLGNIWRFPYIMGKYGGAVFLIIYLGLILTICFVPLCVELFLGKTIKKDNVGVFEEINPKFKYIGFSNVITGILISSFYFVVGGWILYYIRQSLLTFNVQNYGDFFTGFVQNGILTSSLTFLFIFVVCFFVAKGVKKGIEIANKIMMPLFAIILIFLVICSLHLPNAELGLNYMFKPDFSKISSEMFLAALGQAFFTLSIGMGAIMIYGSYMKNEDSIKKSAYTIILSDTMFAILAGVMIFPAVFSFGLQPDSGAGLVFVTLPQIFSQIAGGKIIAFLFFILLMFAALTSGISIVEVPVSTISERYKIKRVYATLITGIIIGILSIPATLSFGILSEFKIFGKDVFSLFDFVTSNLLLPLNTLFACLVCGWVYKIKKGDIFVNGFSHVIFNFVLKFILPIALFALIVFGIRG